MKFKFRLEKAARFFDQREMAKKLELASVMAQLNRLKIELQKFENENREVFNQNSKVQTVAAPWIKVWMDRVEANLADIKRVQIEIESVLEIVEIKKMELSAISKRKKALEKVKEKRLAEFKIQKSRAEQKKLDENYQILELTKE
jgi:flagellar FliJ protein